MAHSNTRNRHRWTWRLQRWHRWIGVTSALFVCVLSLTGLLLLFTDALRLDSRTVTSDPLLDWYGVAAPSNVTAYPAGEHWVVQAGRRLYVNASPATPVSAPLVGAADLGDFLVAATTKRLYLLMPDGQLVEALGASAGVPNPMTRVGRTDDGRLAVAGDGAVQVVGLEELDWSDHAPEAIRWSQPAPLPEALQRTVTAAHRGDGLPLERVLLDLHSGRILGTWGVWLMAAAATLFLLLALTGFWLWLRQSWRAR